MTEEHTAENDARHEPVCATCQDRGVWMDSPCADCVPALVSRALRHITAYGVVRSRKRDGHPAEVEWFHPADVEVRLR